MEARFIYRNRLDARFYDASKGEMRGGPDKVIVYVNGVLCAMDREARIVIPVSRWKLAEIGFACFLAALKGKGNVPDPAVISQRSAASRVPRPPPERSPNQPRKLQVSGAPKPNGSALSGKCAIYLNKRRRR